MILKQENLDIFKQVTEQFKNHYPQTAQKFDFSTTENLFSSFHLQLSQKVFQQVKKSIQDFYQIKKQEAYKNLVLRDNLKPLVSSLQNESVLCCFDFHYQPESEKLKLIEINTNASAYLIGLLTYAAHGLETQKFKQTLIESFKASNLLKTDRLYIMDSDPENEKMYLEFLLYQETLSALHNDVRIIDSQDLENKITSLKKEKTLAIYNRDTDFYFEQLPEIFKAYQQQDAIFSPHPLDYDLMAKKTNLEHLYKYMEKQEGFKSFELQKTLLQTGLVQSEFESLEDLIDNKKRLFFKPAMSFGSKATYKGASVSKKYLNQIWENNMLFQENFPAGKFTDADGQKWKFDLRFYTYNGEVQFWLARTYQGQITNFKTQGGGFAPVVFG